MRRKKIVLDIETPGTGMVKDVQSRGDGHLKEYRFGPGNIRLTDDPDVWMSGIREESSQSVSEEVDITRAHSRTLDFARSLRRALRSERVAMRAHDEEQKHGDS